MQHANSRGMGGGAPGGGSDRLPYRIELWHKQDGGVERVLARAVSAALARAIFEAVRREHPERRITLCRGARMLADTEPVHQRREPTHS